MMELNIGVAGVGNFARFAMKEFSKIPGIKIVAVTDINESVVMQTAAKLDATGYTTYERFLDDSRIDLVYIATPPFLHYPQSKMALLKGKHVICEKPAALKTAEATELAALAKSLNLLWVVNLMQRYNPMIDIVKKIIDEKILGDFLHGFFENYASDENLDPGHWFWDETKSGGIFIEHGVHFFDLFSGWFGEGTLLHAVELERNGTEKKLVDRVQATVLYNNALVNFYHGFDQPKILDRQEIRLEFERGDISLYEWVPVKLRLNGLLDNIHLERLHKLMAGCSIISQTNAVPHQHVKGRFKDIPFDTHTILEYGNVSEKQNCYEDLLRTMMEDQWNWIKDRSHERVIDDNNAVASLAMAEAAQQFAKKLK